MACALIRQVNSEQSIIDHWTFGGGTAMMLQIDHRGSSIKPRDIFDIAAAGEQHADSVIDALRSYRTEVQTTLGVIDKLNPDFVNSAIAQLAIKDKFRSVAKTALKQTNELLRAV
jgi:hydrogenase maturation factor HypE